MRTKTMRLVLAVLSTVMVVSCKPTVKETVNDSVVEQPNIIVMLCDDLGYGDLSSFGHPIIKTPNLDQLAASGLKLTNFYSATPVCSPSRVGLLTGRNPNRAGVYDFIVGGRKERDDLKDLVHLKADEETIPGLLKEAGYSTCLVGKWHGSSLFNFEKQPQPDHFGFEHWFATHNNAAPSHQNPRNFVRNGTEVGELQGFSSQLIVDEAIEWIGKEEGDNPFFLEVAFYEPHEPIASPENLVEKYLQFTTLTAKKNLVYLDAFEFGLENWKVEQMPGGTVEHNNGKLEITDVAGCTIWLKQKLKGPIMITYDAYVIDEGGPQDRVSDLNCFWMAKDMEHPDNLFANSEKRHGKFSNYDSLRLYYMGVGGHDNSKTRFRRYVGDGNRPLLPEHDLSEQNYLIEPNKIAQIKIIAFKGIIQYYRNGERIVDFHDPNPYTSGHFGLRTVNNHMTADNFKVYRLEANK